MPANTPGKSHKVAFYADIFYDSELSPAFAESYVVEL